MMMKYMPCEVSIIVYMYSRPGREGEGQFPKCLATMTTGSEFIQRKTNDVMCIVLASASHIATV